MGRGRGQDTGRRPAGTNDYSRAAEEVLGLGGSLGPASESTSRYGALAAQLADEAGIHDASVTGVPGPYSLESLGSWSPTAANGFADGRMGAMPGRRVAGLPDEQIAYLMGRSRDAGHSMLSPLIHGVDDNDQPVGPSPEIVERNRAAADSVGIEIPAPNENFCFTPQLSRFGAMIRDWYDMGGRSYAAFGPHGAGKNMLFEEMAASLKTGYCEIDLGHGFTIHDAIGATGLGPVQTPDGTWIQGTREEQGKLTRLSVLPVFAAINEVESQADQLESLHNLLGARLGDPSKRFVTINSPSGQTMNVMAHPDFQLVMTWNPGREDARLKEATMDRVLPMEFTYGSQEEECERVAVLLNAIVGKPILGREIDVKEIEPDVKFARVCRRAYDVNQLEYQMGPRKIVQLAGIRLLQQAWDRDDATSTALEVIKFAIPQNMDADAKIELLTSLAHEAYTDIIDSGSD